MTAVVVSKGGSRIRLTDERLAHITEEHCELAGLRLEVLDTIATPARVVAGGAGELLALRELEVGKWLVAVYRETEQDGFVITAFVTRRSRAFTSRRQIWPEPTPGTT